MIVTCKQNDLRAALDRARHISSDKPTLPVLACVRLTAVASGKLVIEATNLALYFREEIDAVVEEAGQAVVDSKELTRVIRSLTGNVRLSSDFVDLRVDVRMPVSQDKFESPDTCATQHGFSMKFGDFQDAIKRVYFAVCNDQARPALNGIRFDVNDVPVIVAADGFRLVTQAIKIEDLSGAGAFTMPVKMADELIGLNLPKDTKIVIESGNIIKVTVGNVTLSGVPCGTFPDYKTLIACHESKQVAACVKVNSGDLKNAILNCFDRTDLMTKRCVAKMEVLASGGIVLSKVSYEKVHKYACNAIIVTGDNPITIGFDPSYILDVLALAKDKDKNDKEVTISLVSPDSAFTVKLAGDDSFLYLCMPAWLKE